MAMDYITLNLQAQQAFQSEGGESSVFFNGVAKTNGTVERWFGVLGFDFQNIEISENYTNVLWAHRDDLPAIGRAKLSFSDNSINVDFGEVYKTSSIPHAMSICELLTRGHPCSLSLGLAGDLEEYGAKKKVILNGEEQEVDAVLRNIRVIENSFVNTPADAETFAQKMKLSAEKRSERMNKKDAASPSTSEVVEPTGTAEQNDVGELLTAFSAMAEKINLSLEKINSLEEEIQALKKDEGEPKKAAVDLKSVNYEKLSGNKTSAFLGFKIDLENRKIVS